MPEQINVNRQTNLRDVAALTARLKDGDYIEQERSGGSKTLFQRDPNATPSTTTRTQNRRFAVP